MTETHLVNLMPHDLVVIDGGRFVLTSSGQVTRFRQTNHLGRCRQYRTSKDH